MIKCFFLGDILREHGDLEAGGDEVPRRGGSHEDAAGGDGAGDGARRALEGHF